MALILNVRAGEGGDDSKLLVQDMVAMYKRWMQSKGFSLLSEG